MIQLPRVGWRLLACLNGDSPDIVLLLLFGHAHYTHVYVHMWHVPNCTRQIKRLPCKRPLTVPGGVGPYKPVDQHIPIRKSTLDAIRLSLASPSALSCSGSRSLFHLLGIGCPLPKNPMPPKNPVLIHQNPETTRPTRASPTSDQQSFLP